MRFSNVQLGEFADLRGFKAGSLLTSYLALPLCLGVASKGFWNPVVESLENKLDLWKANYLSLHDRITLIKVGSLKYADLRCRFSNAQDGN